MKPGQERAQLRVVVLTSRITVRAVSPLKQI